MRIVKVSRRIFHKPFRQYVILAAIILIHFLLLNSINHHFFPEIVFPVSMIRISSFYISEDHLFHPPLLYYLLAGLSTIVDLHSAFYLIHGVFVILTDTLLFLSVRRFGMKIAILSLFFYIPWQVFFRGYSLWFDYATIPFIAISFLFILNYIKTTKWKYLFFGSVTLTLGLLFKQTIIWILLLYIAIAVYLSVSQSRTYQHLLFSILTIILPLCLVFSINFLVILLITQSINFTSLWTLVMPFFVTPRLAIYSKAIAPAYFRVILLLLGFGVISAALFLSHKKNRQLGLVLCSITAASLLNIFPRWSDFRIQPFLFFLSIMLALGVAASKTSTKLIKRVAYSFLSILIIGSLIVWVNRIRIESKRTIRFDHLTELELMIKPQADRLQNKTIFTHDSPSSFGPSSTDPYPTVFSEQLKLLFTNPLLYYRLTASDAVLEVLRNRNPQTFITTGLIHDRIQKNNDLTKLEKFVKTNYTFSFKLTEIYYVYERK